MVSQLLGGLWPFSKKSLLPYRLISSLPLEILMSGESLPICIMYTSAISSNLFKNFLPLQFTTCPGQKHWRWKWSRLLSSCRNHSGCLDRVFSSSVLWKRSLELMQSSRWLHLSLCCPRNISSMVSFNNSICGFVEQASATHLGSKPRQLLFSLDPSTL